MSLQDRLKSLEAAAAGRPCPTCGGGDGDNGVRAVFIPLGSPPSGPCLQCGRSPKVIRIRAINRGNVRQAEPPKQEGADA